MRLELTYSGPLKSGAFVEVKAQVNSEELSAVIEQLDESVDLQEPFLPELDFGPFGGDPDFGGTIEVGGSDPTE